MQDVSISVKMIVKRQGRLQLKLNKVDIGHEGRCAGSAALYISKNYAQLEGSNRPVTKAGE